MKVDVVSQKLKSELLDCNLKKIFHDEAISMTVRNESKVGRNDPCPCGAERNIKSAVEK